MPNYDSLEFIYINWSIYLLEKRNRFLCFKFNIKKKHISLKTNEQKETNQENENY